MNTSFQKGRVRVEGDTRLPEREERGEGIEWGTGMEGEMERD